MTYISSFHILTNQSNVKISLANRGGYFSSTPSILFFLYKKTSLQRIRKIKKNVLDRKAQEEKCFLHTKFISTIFSTPKNKYLYYDVPKTKINIGKVNFLQQLYFLWCPVSAMSLEIRPWQRYTPTPHNFFQTDTIERDANAIGMSIPPSGDH